MSMPNTAVKNSVALNAVLLPMRSEPSVPISPRTERSLMEREIDAQVPHPTAPIIIPANIAAESTPM